MKAYLNMTYRGFILIINMGMISLSPETVSKNGMLYEILLQIMFNLIFKKRSNSVSKSDQIM